MSRSYRTPIARISASIDRFIRRRWRHKVKQELKKPESAIPIIETDVKKSGLAECGTWFGWPSGELLAEEKEYWEETIKKLKRK